MRALIGTVLVLLLAGCGGGPDPQVLRGEVERRLAGALPQGTVEIVEFARRGSQRYRGADAGDEQRVAYFDLELRLLRDYDFGSWDSQGVAGLASALGAAPRGLIGVATGGNRAGDVLRAHGTMLYARRAETWEAVAPQGYGPVVAPRQAAPETLLEALRDTLSRVPPEASPAVREALQQELGHAYAAVNARLARFESGYAIAAGPEGGQYLRLVQAFAANPGARVVPLVTAGGEENLRLLREGRADLALSQGDAVLAAYRGEGIFAGEGPFPLLHAVGALYPEVVHVIVRADAQIDAVAQLRGRRVAIGAQGSATQMTARVVLAAHGLEDGAMQARELGLSAAMAALRERELDAVIAVIGLPADSIRVAAPTVPLRLLALERAAVDSLVAGSPAYLAFTIPGGTYPGSGAPIQSVATPAVLLARADLSAAEVGVVTRSVYASRHDLVALGSSQGAQVSVATATLGIPVPQHQGAIAALEALQDSRAR